MTTIKATGRSVAVLILATLAAAAMAQQPVRIYVGFAAGGSTDLLARHVAEKMRQSLGRAMIVENRPGAAGRLAVEAAKAGAPDGSVMMIVPNGPMTLFPHIFRDLKFDPLKDFTPIAQLAVQDMCLAVGPSVLAKSLGELREWLRANPDKGSYGSAGAGTVQHFTGVLFAQRTGLSLVHVPYKGSAPAAADLAAGHIPMVVSSCTELIELHKAGKVRILNSSGRTRSPFTPELPTFREGGIDIEVSAWFALYGPAGMPAPLVAQLNKAAADAVRVRDGVDPLLSIGLVAAASTAEELARTQKADYELWGAAARASGFKPTD
jgi:tripartite-type tricarboxylate transporter receptor subunit TctC